MLHTQNGEGEIDGSEDAADEEALLAQFGGSDEEDGEEDMEQEDEEAAVADGDEHEDQHRWETASRTVLSAGRRRQLLGSVLNYCHHYCVAGPCWRMWWELRQQQQPQGKGNSGHPHRQQ
jgi:hypothetical protein